MKKNKQLPFDVTAKQLNKRQTKLTLVHCGLHSVEWGVVVFMSWTNSIVIEWPMINDCLLVALYPARAAVKPATFRL